MYISQYPPPDIGNSFCLVVRIFGSEPKGPRFYPAAKTLIILGLLYGKSYLVGQTSSQWCGAEVWRGVVSSGVVLVFSSRLKVIDPSQNSPRVASKRDVNITKLN
ncbi:hypothetical protein AVEN_205517-1 [Araneus ventricosus]|uniref:Uncharacterized protein n=1 Tax=Araneus ventricosus TaxID=182803 RepID=A0A4Y2TRX3_ARAVE|nr:hypothetical protein AVEN_186620-1 [Araneus ventricosus]GBO02883.1 hypothetical protein AVEN_205517-1 [Araneus ventricosus]